MKGRVCRGRLLTKTTGKVAFVIYYNIMCALGKPGERSTPRWLLMTSARGGSDDLHLSVPTTAARIVLAFRTNRSPGKRRFPVAKL